MIKKEYTKDLTRLNTFGMKVSASCYIEYDSIADLLELDFEELKAPVRHIGSGSNLLFTGDFKGTLLHSKINFIEELPGEGLVSVGSGVLFDDFCLWACQRGLWGSENLSGIPGEVGAAAVQNIGAYGVEFSDIAHMVYCYDTTEEEFVHFKSEDCGYAYRDSMFKHSSGRYIVTHVVFRLSSVAKPRLDYGNLKTRLSTDAGLQQIRDAVLQLRSGKLPDPKVMGSAGSFFKNPVVDRKTYDYVCGIVPDAPYYQVGDMYKIPAAWLIEQCGWKGRRSGNAAVYEKQPLVIVNYNGLALPEEIVALENKVKASVKHKFSIELQPEVEHL